MLDDTLNRLRVCRGSELPHSKLDEQKILEIQEIVEYRNWLDDQRAKLTNAKIAEHYNVHVRTVDRVTAFETWTHIVRTG